ncbi:MAG: hypothetical protein KGZ39_01000 [Simkania sp.]|nr:hypothetical protein [Simkania sp.]
MDSHLFLMQPLAWLGEGLIKLNMVDEELSFFTRWSMSPRSEIGEIECLQEIQIKGMTDIMHNQFIIRDFTSNSFSIELENQALGKIQGSGIISDKVIAWEFRVRELGFEGFEFYEKQHDNSYIMRAEYATTDQFRTVINGRVWQPIKA